MSQDMPPEHVKYWSWTTVPYDPSDKWEYDASIMVSVESVEARERWIVEYIERLLATPQTPYIQDDIITIVRSLHNLKHVLRRGGK